MCLKGGGEAEAYEGKRNTQRESPLSGIQKKTNSTHLLKEKKKESKKENAAAIEGLGRGKRRQEKNDGQEQNETPREKRGNPQTMI